MYEKFFISCLVLIQFWRINWNFFGDFFFDVDKHEVCTWFSSFGWLAANCCPKIKTKIPFARHFHLLVKILSSLKSNSTNEIRLSTIFYHIKITEKREKNAHQMPVGAKTQTDNFNPYKILCVTQCWTSYVPSVFFCFSRNSDFSFSCYLLKSFSFHLHPFLIHTYI